jgi:hypothetical protein
MEHDAIHDHEQANPNAPDFVAWHVSGGGRRSKPRWHRIGAAWMHRDGKGVNIQLDLLPACGGRIVLRSPKSHDDAGSEDHHHSA